MSIIDRGPDKHGRQRFEVRVSCGYKNGKQVRVVKTFFCKTKKAAQKKMEQYLIQNNLSTEEFKSTYQTTFADFLAIWKKRHASKLAVSTQIKNQSLLDNHILDYFSGKVLTKITDNDIRNFIDDMRNLKAIKGGKQTDKPISSTMVYNYFKLLRSIFQKAVNWRYLSENPCELLDPEERPRPKYHPAPIWQEADLKRFIQFLENLPDSRDTVQKKTIFYLFLITGIRRGELSALTYDCINEAEQSILINKAIKHYDGESITISDPKTEGSIRKVFIDDYTMSLLKKHAAYQKQFLEEAGLKNPKNFVFITQRRNGDVIPITPSYFYMWLRKVAKLLALPLIDVHSLRHMAASYALANGAPLTSVSSQLGHTSLRTTERYLHELDARRRDSARILSKEITTLREGT